MKPAPPPTQTLAPLPAGSVHALCSVMLSCFVVVCLGAVGGSVGLGLVALYDL